MGGYPSITPMATTKLISHMPQQSPNIVMITATATVPSNLAVAVSVLQTTGALEMLITSTFVFLGLCYRFPPGWVLGRAVTHCKDAVVSVHAGYIV